MRLAILFVFLLCFVFTSTILSAPKDPDLIFYFNFEEVKGNTALDQSGNGHDGDIKGSIKIVDGGKFGKCAEFQTGDYIDMRGADFPADQIPKSAITLCAWVNIKNNGGDHAIFNARATDQTWIIHPEAKSGGTFRWLLRTDGGTTIFDFQAGSVSWGSWQHYAGTYDGKIGILYIDGEKVAEGNGGAKIAKDWGSGARIGKNIDDARPFTGLMDDINLWKKALTKDEIKAIMEQSLDGVFKSQAVSPIGNATSTWGRLKSQ